MAVWFLCVSKLGRATGEIIYIDIFCSVVTILAIVVMDSHDGSVVKSV